MSEVQLYVIAFIAPILVYVVNILAKAKVQLHRGWLTAIVYVISGGLALAWSAAIFPPFPGWEGELGLFIPALFQYLTDMLTALGPAVALGTLIYNALLGKVLDGLADKLGIKRGDKERG